MAGTTGVSHEQLGRAVRVLIERIKAHDLLSYRAFAKSTGIDSNYLIANLLGFLSESTNKRGYGLASVVVRGEDGDVGFGFFLLAQALGYEIKPQEEDVFVLEQTYKVYALASEIEAALMELIERSGTAERREAPAPVTPISAAKDISKS